MPNDLPAVRIADDTALLPLHQWDDLICRLTVAEARLATHHRGAFDSQCRTCMSVQKL